MAETKPPSLQLSPALSEFLERYGDRPTTQAREDLELLAAVLDWAQEETAGRFTTAEALLLCESLVQTVLQPGEGRLDSRMRESVAEAIRYRELDRKWGVDALALAGKLEALSLAETLAVWHWVKMFWVNPDWDHRKVAGLFRTER